MPQLNDLSRSLVALDQDSTIIAVVELSQSSWLAIRCGGSVCCTRQRGFIFSSDYEAAAEAAEVAIRSYPDFPGPYRWLAAALGQAGRAVEAKKALTSAIAVA